uniref:Transmembrane protein n=1 Tax=Trypanosoma congolense (strain IL3000) TaxID=1068625 RepID=G0ULY8_TRYCI|nr:conserved hypothetical protein [Trypanosoma congolense IL3000]
MSVDRSLFIFSSLVLCFCWHDPWHFVTLGVVDSAVAMNTSVSAAGGATVCGGASCDESALARKVVQSRKLAQPHCQRECAPVWRVGANVAECVNSTLLEAVVGILPHANHSQRCIRCGGDMAMAWLMNATYANGTDVCVCPLGYRVIEQVGDVLLSAQMCAPCSGRNCIACAFPCTKISVSECACSRTHAQLCDSPYAPSAEGIKLPNKTDNTAASVVSETAANGEIWGAPLSCETMDRYAVDAAAQCERGDVVACNMVANLCVSMLYKEAAVPCYLYRSLLSTNATQHYLPQLYYGRYDVVLPDIFDSSLATTGVPELKFLITRYSWNGSLLGRSVLLEELNLCDRPGSSAEQLFMIASDREIRCSVPWTELLPNHLSTDFFELSVVSVSNKTHVVPVPVVVDYTNDDIAPMGARELHTFCLATGGYKRRFYLHDKSCAGGDSTEGSPLGSYHMRVLRRIAFVFSVDSEGILRRLKTPVGILQYSSRALYSNVSAHAFLHAHDAYVPRSVAVLFTSVIDYTELIVMLVMIVLCVFCFFSAWAKTYSWMRRRQNMMLDLGSIARFVAYLCDNVGSAFAFATSLVSWCNFILYKFQSSSEMVIIKCRYTFIEVMIFVAATAKGVAVVYAIIEQCNADIFLIDWERSRGQLLHEDRVLPVSMWRSAFVVRELNRLQTLRQWHPLFTMAITLLMLVGMDYINHAESVPSMFEEGVTDTLHITTLRTAILTFLWATVSAAVYVLEYQFYYRLVRVHPLRSFVDLCSVSNISVLILPEAQWGYYIHGESIHGHSDVSMEEFQRGLLQESQGNLPFRGLGGRRKCQTFEVFMSAYTRHYLCVCSSLVREEQRQLSAKVSATSPVGKEWHMFWCLYGVPGKSRSKSARVLAITRHVNDILQNTVRSAEGAVLMKSHVHGLLGVAPNILYMNGQRSNDKVEENLFFSDSTTSYGNAFLYGLDFDLFIFYVMLCAAVDAVTHNIYCAFLTTVIAEAVIQLYRRLEGVANLSSNTFIDSCFFT